jgi:hypothetical protein
VGSAPTWKSKYSDIHSAKRIPCTRRLLEHESWSSVTSWFVVLIA